MSQYYGVRSWDSVKHTETWSRGLGTVPGVPELVLSQVWDGAKFQKTRTRGFGIA